MSLNLDFVIDALSRESKKVRANAAFAYEVMKRECGHALSTPERLGKKYFVKRSRTVYRGVDEQAKEDAIRVCFDALYAHCLQFNEHLVPPTLFLRLEQRLPVFHDDAPPLALQRVLNEWIHYELEQTKRAHECTLALTLLLAKHAQLTSVSKLMSVLKCKLSELVIFKDAQLAALFTSNAIILLDAIAIRAFSILQSQKGSFKAGDMTRELRAKLMHFQAASNQEFQSLTLNEALNALTFSSRSLAFNSFDTTYTQLDKADFISALSGQSVGDTSHLTSVSKKATHKRRYSPELLSVEQITELFNVTDESVLAIDTRTSSHDSEVLDIFRKLTYQYERNDKEQSRNSEAFREFKSAALTLMSTIYESNKATSVSLTTTAILTYCVDLSVYGSRFKDKLAMSTVRDYLSVIKNFAEKVWSDEQLLQEAQSSVAALEELTEDVSGALGDIQASEKQGVALGFLQYLSQSTTIKFFDGDELECCGAGSLETRAHYISKQDFAATCSNFLSLSSIAERKQFVLFANLVYATGLRKQEVAQLEIADVREDLGAIYISRLVKRKTARAIRRFPLSALTKELESELLTHMKTRKANGYTDVFDEGIIAAFSDEFLKLLREQCNNEKLVLHSLRHSAANNLVLLFALCCIPQLRDYRNRLHFLMSDTFADEQLNRVSAELERLGRAATTFFATLDTVAQLLGHVGPGVTAASYLHLLDVVFFIHSSTQREAYDNEVVLQLLERNNYRFEVKKRLEACKDNINEQRRLVFSSSVRALSSVASYSLIQNTETRSSQAPSALSFNAYLLALQNYKQQSSANCNAKLLAHFHSVAPTLDILCLSNEVIVRSSSWLRMLQSISNVTWIAKNANAIDAFTRTILTDEITNRRLAHQHLRALKLLAVQPMTIDFYPAATERSPIQKWQRMLKKEGFELKIQNANRKRISIRSKPARVPTKFWANLQRFVLILNSYIAFVREQDIAQPEVQSWS